MANPFANQTPGFGQGNPFGTTSTGFGASGFGNSASSGFASTGSSVFSGSNNTSGFGGSGTPSTGFGLTQRGSGFGAGSSSIFGGSGTNQTGSGFGSSEIPQTSSGFGGGSSSIFGGSGTMQTGSGFGGSSSIFGGSGTTQAGSGFGGSSSIFGGSGTTQTTGGFGGSGTTQTGSGFGGSSSIFGGSGTTQAGSGFGGSSSIFGGSGTNQTTGGFGGSGTTQTGSGFGGSGNTHTGSILSGSGTIQTGSGFGGSGTIQTGSGFGGSGTTQTGSIFGGSGTIQTGSGFGGFGTTQTSSGFGGSGTTQTGSGFGGSGTTQTGSIFGGFGTTQTSSGFGINSTQTGSGFGGSGSSQIGSGFGGGSSSGFSGSRTTKTSSVFGSSGTSQTGSGLGLNSRSIFGGSGTTQTGGFGGSSHSSFGVSVTSRADSQTGSGFSSTHTGSESGFGNSSSSGTGFAVNQPNVYGGTTDSFGTVSSGTQSQGSASVFGSPVTTNSTFAGSSFGATSGEGVFGIPSTSTRVFGASDTTSSAGLFNKTETDSTVVPGVFGQTSNTKVFGVPKTTTSSLFAQTTGASGFASDMKKSESSKNLFGKPKLKTKPLVTELSPPSTVFNAVNSSSSVFSGINSSSGQRSPRLNIVKPTTSGLFGKPTNKDNDDKQKGQTKKMLFGKPVEETGTRRPSFDEPGTSFDILDQTTKRKPSKENDEEPQSKRSIRRMSSTDESRVAIVCNHVPNKYNNVIFMKKHFSKYGEVVKVFSNPRKSMATVHFRTHEDAKEAKNRGKFLAKGERALEIYWSTFTSPSLRSRSFDDDRTPGKRKSNESLTSNTHTNKSAKFTWARHDLDDELSSMAGPSDVTEEQMKIMDRPDALVESQVKGVGRPTHSVIDSMVQHPSSGPSTSKTAVNIPTNIDTGSLTVLRTTVCHTSAEKLQILNLRDKIIRLGMKKTANLKSKAFVGSCTDMCPERERYDREEKRRIHVYETLNSGSQNPQVDHSRAVKEYSRSSADQEEPLPHELRPLPTLMLTMNYLLSEIADRGEDGKWGDWFDFLWDRTRGIRKDITQQQISTPESAELLEKCVRFHIFCSERLCEEDMHVFDLKINNENMTKCLQTLKEFYHDLETKHNTLCRNEAELRSYMVLMNLNEGDILRETQQLRQEVRNTQYINFAVQVHSALNSNNFVKFFKLARNASFLQACIMHRYFTQVRTKALLTIIKAYRPKSHYSLTEMVRILGFENKIEARYFCKFHGLNTMEDFVILDKTSYIDPEETWPPRRCQKFIESKLTCSVGEAINGEPLPIFSLPQPTNSFDQNHRFIGKLDVSVTDIPETEVKAPVVPSLSAPQPEVKPEVKAQTLQYNNDDVKDIAKHLFWEVINDMAKEVSQDLIQGAQMMATETQNVCNVMVEEVVTEYVRSLSESYYSEVSLIKEKRDKEVMIQSSAVHFTTEIIKDVVDQEVLNMATAEIREIKAQLKKEQMERCNIEICDELMNLISEEISQEVAEEVFQKDVIERIEKLNDICHCIELQRAGKYLQRWKKEYSATIKLKRSMLEFPAAVGMDSNYDQVKRLIPTRHNEVCDSNGFYINKLAKLKIDTPDKDLTIAWVVDRMLTAHELYRKMCNLKAWQPLDIAATAGSCLQKHFTRCKSRTFYWKLVLSLPDVNSCTCAEDKETAELLNKWLKSKFTKGKDELASVHHNEDMLSLYRTNIPFCHSEKVQDLGLCIRAETDKDLKHSDLLGTNGLIFVLPPGITENLSSKYWTDTKRRLQTLMLLKPKYPAIPLVILAPMLASEELDDLINTGLDIQYYLDEGMVSSVFFRTVDLLEDGILDVTQPELTEELCECVQWLADAYPQQPDIRVMFLKDFIDDQLLNKFFDPVLQNLKLRKKKGHLHQYPEQLAQLYNHVIDHLTKVLTSQSLKDQSWPVAEFFTTDNPYLGIPPSHWNSEDHMDYIEQMIEKLQLPWFLNDDFEKDDWSDICEVVWEYMDKVADDDDVQAKVNLFTKIKLILQKTEEDFADICYLVERETKCEPSHENIPWTDIITACIDYKLSVINFKDAQVSQNFELMAVYLKKDLNGYRPPEIWKYLESEKDVDVTISMKASIQTAKIKTVAKKEEQSPVYEKNVPFLEKRAAIILRSEPQSVQAASNISVCLARELKKEQIESEQYEKFLQNALMSGDVNDTVVPDVSRLPQWSLFDSPNRTVTGDHILSTSVSEPLITDEFDRLKKEINSNRRASDLFEQRLRQWMESPV